VFSRPLLSDVVGERDTPCLILVVDDEKGIRGLLSELFESAGCRPILAPDGDAALVELNSHSGIEIMVVDIRMPGMNGIEVAERAAKKYPRLKIIQMSGYTDVPPSPRWPFISKPFHMEDLLRLIAGELSPNPGGDAT
jgi:two-component system cell cycle response regulator CpdR